MKSRTILGLALAPMLLAAWSAHAQQSAEQLLQSGLYKEQVEGDLSSAIGIYESIIANFPDERSVAAKALVQLGQCHEKLGSIEARRAYERVLNDYVDQREQARFARARLAALTPENLAASGVLARQVWAGPEVDIFGAPSPDGRYLSFVDWNTGDLAIRDLSSGKSQHLTHKGSWSESTAYAEFSVVSPNGKQLAYTWFGEDQVHDLRVVGVNGSEPRVLLRNEEVHIVSPAAWSTDGKNILVLLTRKDRTNQIAIISVADGLLRVLKTLDWRQPQKMSLSPDGRYIAYDFPPDEESEQRDIFLLAADGSSETPLIQHPGDDLFPVWAPDGKRIVFVSDRTGSKDAWAISVAEGKPVGSPEMVKADIGRVFPMGFTQKGSYYYGVATGMSDVFVARLDPATGKLMEAPRKASEQFVGRNVSPAWSPDGKYLAYVSYRGSLAAPLNDVSGTIVIRSIDTGEERELKPSITSYEALRPEWSPDGTAFQLVGHDEKGRQGVYQVDAQTGEVTAIIQSDEILAAGWLPDGRAILYVRRDATWSTVSIVRRDLATGLEEVGYQVSLASTLPRYGAISPDGQEVARVDEDRGTGSRTLIVVPVTGGEPRAVYEGPIPMSYNGGLAWTPDGRGILFSASRPDADPDVAGLQLERDLWRISVDGGEPQRLELAMDNLRNITIHPDGQHIAFTAGERKFEVWVMENLLADLESTK